MQEIFVPVLVQVALTFVLLSLLGPFRVIETLSKPGVREKVAQGDRSAYSKVATQVSDNFSNQFEVPVLFYTGVLIAVVMDVVTPYLTTLAWIFVASRIVHSLIHCTINFIPLRFLVFLGGVVTMLIFWWTLGSQILAG